MCVTTNDRWEKYTSERFYNALAPGREEEAGNVCKRLGGQREGKKHTSNDVDEVVGDGGLAQSVVLQLEGGNHVVRVL